MVSKGKYSFSNDNYVSKLPPKNAIVSGSADTMGVAGSTGNSVPTSQQPSMSSINNINQEARAVDDEEDDLPCGWCITDPSCCQRFRIAKVVLPFLCCAAAIQGMVVNGFLNVVVSTLEKRFELSSTQSGIIVSSYDIASVLALIPVSYFGGRGSKPHWLAGGMFLIAIGSVLFSLPHFLTDTYEFESTREDNVCYLQDDNVTDSCDGSSLSDYRYFFIIGNLFHGVGAAPLYTLGVTYLEENLKTKVSVMYIGIFYACSLLGPALGYLLGGQFLSFFTDFETVDTDTLRIDSDNVNWVGAWWLGFLISAALSVLIAIPLWGFPKYLPGTAVVRAEKVSEAHGGESTEDISGGLGIKDILFTFKCLLTNPTFMFLNLAAAAEGLLTNGFSAFAPKFIQAQFNISAGLAAIYIGVAAIPFGALGMIIGSFIVKKLKLKCRGILRLCIISSLLSLVGCVIFLVRCETVDFAGVNSPYINTNMTSEANLTSQCNDDCHCLKDRFDPVCTAAGVQFFSPCHAGCLNVTEVDDTKRVYSECGCVNETSLPLDADHPVTGGQCGGGCNTLLAIFLLGFGLVIFFTFFTAMPALTATLRCVSDKHRSLALGVQWIMVRCLGTIPAPIAFGALIDTTCILWQDNCGDQGSCYFYNNKNMSNYLLLLGVVGKVVTLFFLVVSHFLYKPPPATGMSTAGASTASTAYIVDSVRGDIGSSTQGASNPALAMEARESPTKY